MWRGSCGNRQPIAVIARKREYEIIISATKSKGYAQENEIGSAELSTIADQNAVGGKSDKLWSTGGRMVRS